MLNDNFFQIKYHPDGPEGAELEIDFTPPFRKIYMISALEEILKTKFPNSQLLGTKEANEFLSALCVKHQASLIIYLTIIKVAVDLWNWNGSAGQYTQQGWKIAD